MLSFKRWTLGGSRAPRDERGQAKPALAHASKRAHAVVAAAACAAHATALAGGFVWLDHAHIEDGLALVGQGQGIASWLALFTTGFAGTGFYRPLMSVSLSIDAARTLVLDGEHVFKSANEASIAIVGRPRAEGQIG